MGIKIPTNTKKTIRGIETPQALEYARGLRKRNKLFEPDWPTIDNDCRQFMYESFEELISNFSSPLLVTPYLTRIFVGKTAENRFLAGAEHPSHDELIRRTRQVLVAMETALPIAFHEEAKRAYGSLEHENCVSLVHEKLPPFSFMVCKAFVGIFLIIRYRQNIFVNSPPKEIESKMIEMASKIGRFSTRGEKSFVTPEYWLTDEDGNRRFETSDATVIRKVKK